MLCPYCQNPDSRVIDKRDSAHITRRRRECAKCERRYNTQETVEEVKLKVVKKDGRREDFDRDKLKRGLERASEKRPISTQNIESMILRIEEKLRKKGKEITSQVIGEYASKELRKADKIAYIRFASVYHEFSDISDFKKEFQELIKK